MRVSGRSPDTTMSGQVDDHGDRQNAARQQDTFVLFLQVGQSPGHVHDPRTGLMIGWPRDAGQQSGGELDSAIYAFAPLKYLKDEIKY